MSKYEQYEVTSQDYDTARTPMDSKGLRKALELTAKTMGKPMSELQVLDAGCGTGNYLESIADLPCQFTGFDGSPGMIEKAQEKFAGKHKHINCYVGNLTKMDFKDNSFDFIMTTQVLHHLQTPNAEDETKEPTDWSTLEKCMSEFGRVLRPGGSYWCQTSTPEQQMNGFWWAAVVPRAVKIVGVKFPSLQRLTDNLKKGGFDQFETYIPSEPLMRKDLYLNIKGPFDVKFRNCDSSWKGASDEELKEAQAKLTKIIEAGETEKFFKEREEVRAKIGQTTTYIARKSLPGKQETKDVVSAR